MATNTAVLRIKIGADSYEFNRAVQKVQSDTRKMAVEMQRVGKNMSMFFTAPLAAIGGLSVKFYDDSARSIAKVEQAIKSTGGAAGFSAEQLQKFASTLQGKTIFEDDEIINKSTAQLLTFTNIAGVNFKRAQVAAMDLSTVLDGDLQSASIQLGKALNDPVKSLSALRKSGIMFSNEQETVIKKLAQTGELAKAQSIILTEIEKQYGGQAERRAKEGAGGLIQLKNKWGDFLEMIGKALMPMINKLCGALSEMVDWLNTLSPSTMSFVVTIGALVTAIGPLLLIIGKTIQLLPLIGKGFLAMINPITLVITALGLLIAIQNKLNGKSNDFADQRRGKGIWTVENIDKAEADYNKQVKIIDDLKKKEQKLLKERDKEVYNSKSYSRLTFDHIRPLNEEITAHENLLKAKLKLLTELREEKKSLADNTNGLNELSVAASISADEMDKLITSINNDDKATGIIGKLTEEIKRLETAKGNAKTKEDIASINSQIETLKKQLDELNIVTSEYLALRNKMADTPSFGGLSMFVPNITATVASIKLNADTAFDDLKKQLNNKFKELGNVNFAKHATQKIAKTLSKYGVDAAKGMTEEMIAVATTIQERASEAMRIVANGMSDVIVATVDAIASGSNIGDALQNVLSGILGTIGKFLIDLGTQAILTGTIMEAFKEAIGFLMVNPLLAVAAGVAMVALGSVLTASLKRKQEKSAPKLANGGLAYGPTYAMVGDNIGAKVDPEVIAPLSKLKGIMGGSGGGNLNIQISGKLVANGRDLSLVLAKENYKIQVMGS